MRAGADGASEAFARASDAAVGAKRPVFGFGDVCGFDDGVFGRAADGVFGRDVLEGVLGRMGVTDAREDGRDLEGVDLAGPDAFAVERTADVDMLG